MSIPMITISHTISVDECIANEIIELNNKHNILTVNSCCNHKEGYYGSVAVHPDDIINMLVLGYVPSGVWNTTISKIVLKKAQKYTFPNFQSKSKCTGKCKHSDGDLK